VANDENGIQEVISGYLLLDFCFDPRGMARVIGAEGLSMVYAPAFTDEVAVEQLNGRF
jgi:hypothetical protein